MADADKIVYQDKLILAPMVRISTLPTRLLSLDYGADIVYCEEIIDFKILHCKRVENSVLNTIDYVWKDETVVFRTCSAEKSKVVFQIGTADAARALKVAKLVEKDVAAIDVNMGCPKEFSIKGGMGAALLQQPEKVKEILTTLVNGVSIPVTCKIRILSTVEDTLAFVRMLAATGVSAIAIHGRRRDERPRHPNHNDVIKAIAESVDVPIISNGGSREIKCFDDVTRFKDATGTTCVMLARAAEWNPSIFRREGALPLDDVIRAYLKYAVLYQAPANIIKYVVQNMMHEVLETPRGKALQGSVSMRQIFDLFGLADFHDDVVLRHRKAEEELRSATGGPDTALKCRFTEDGTQLVEMAFRYNRKEYAENLTPKMILYEIALQSGKGVPKYDTKFDPKERMYHSVLCYHGKKYCSTLWDKSKKSAEQAAAALCLRDLGHHDGRRDLWPSPTDDVTARPAAVPAQQPNSAGSESESARDNRCASEKAQDHEVNISSETPDVPVGEQVKVKVAEDGNSLDNGFCKAAVVCDRPAEGDRDDNRQNTTAMDIHDGVSASCQPLHPSHDMSRVAVKRKYSGDKESGLCDIAAPCGQPAELSQANNVTS